MRETTRIKMVRMAPEIMRTAERGSQTRRTRRCNSQSQSAANGQGPWLEISMVLLESLQLLKNLGSESRKCSQTMLRRVIPMILP